MGKAKVFTCVIFEDQTEKEVLAGSLVEWPKGIPQELNAHLRVALKETNWESVKVVLFQLKPNENAVIPRDLYQYIGEANVPENYKLGPDACNWKTATKPRTMLQHRRAKTSSGGDKPKPSSVEIEAAAKIVEEANNLWIPEPPHIPESAFFANNPNSASFKFPKVHNPDTESTFARVAFIARAETAAQKEGKELASDEEESEDEESDEEDDGNSNASSITVNASEDDNESESDTEDILWVGSPSEKPVKELSAKSNPFNNCEKSFGDLKDAKVNILQGRKKHPDGKVNILHGRKKQPNGRLKYPNGRKKQYGGKRGSRSILDRKPRVPAKKARAELSDNSDFEGSEMSGNDSDYEDDGDSYSVGSHKEKPAKFGFRMKGPSSPASRTFVEGCFVS